jgi:hypothetical protein
LLKIDSWLLEILCTIKMNPELMAARVHRLVKANQKIQRERKLSSVKQPSMCEIKQELKRTPPLTPPLKTCSSNQPEKIDDIV